MKTLSFVASFAAMLALVSCASNVPPPDDEDAEAWTPGIQSSYPDWQPPEEMPEGNPAYAEAFGEPRPVEGKDAAVAVVAAEEKSSASESAPVKKVSDDAQAASASKTKPVEAKPVETKPAVPAKFMRLDVFPAEAGVDGVYAVNGERVNASALKKSLNDAVKANKDFAVILYARPKSAESDMNAAIDWCKAAGITKINVMTNDDIMAQRKAEVRAGKGAKDDSAAGSGSGSSGSSAASAPKAPREKLVVDPDKPATEYIVKDGDSLSSIAKALYHDGTEWEIIFDANKETLNGKPNYLKIGTKLVIPAVKKVAVTPK